MIYFRYFSSSRFKHTYLFSKLDQVKGQKSLTVLNKPKEVESKKNIGLPSYLRRSKIKYLMTYFCTLGTKVKDRVLDDVLPALYKYKVQVLVIKNLIKE